MEVVFGMQSSSSLSQTYAVCIGCRLAWVQVKPPCFKGRDDSYKWCAFEMTNKMTQPKSAHVTPVCKPESSQIKYESKRKIEICWSA